MDTAAAKIQLTARGRMPQKMSVGASGFDLYAALDESITLEPQAIRVIPCGFHIELPPQCEAQIRSRSGLAAKHGIFCLNGVGTIDNDYRGEVGAILANFGGAAFVVEPGMRIAQMVVCLVPGVELVQADTLGGTARGHGGYGSTGKGGSTPLRP